MRSYPSVDELQKLEEEFEDDEVKHTQAFRKILGDLFKIKWYRVVLDEAHQIKNHLTRSESSPRRPDRNQRLTYSQHHWLACSSTPSIAGDCPGRRSQTKLKVWKAPFHP